MAGIYKSSYWIHRASKIFDDPKGQSFDDDSTSAESATRVMRQKNHVCGKWSRNKWIKLLALPIWLQNWETKILPSTHRTPQRTGRVACWRRRLSPWFARSRDVEDTYGTLTTWDPLNGVKRPGRINPASHNLQLHPTGDLQTPALVVMLEHFIAHHTIARFTPEDSPSTAYQQLI